MSEFLTFAVCSYNRSDRLPELIKSMCNQKCPVLYEVLIIDNNSSDNTQDVLKQLSAVYGTKLRYVKETNQGIPHARNRAIKESINSNYMVFIDDDEIPLPGLLESAVFSLKENGAECVGGAVKISFQNVKRPKWLGDELLGFLAEVDYGKEIFWIKDRTTPVWTANVGYRMQIFRDQPDLRFDSRYNRKGKAVGGGSDAIMFRELLARNIKIQYNPGMIVDHHVEEWRLKRSYFLRLHFIAGRKFGQYESGEYSKTLLGVPLFMINQALGQLWTTIAMAITLKPRLLRQAMNFSYATGTIWGRILRHFET